MTEVTYFFYQFTNMCCFNALCSILLTAEPVVHDLCLKLCWLLFDRICFAEVLVVFTPVYLTPIF